MAASALKDDNVIAHSLNLKMSGRAHPCIVAATAVCCPSPCITIVLAL